MPITVAVIFALLFFTFGSPIYAGLVLMNVPFSLVGGIVFLWLRGINLSVSSAVGFISLFGVAVMSGVLVVAEINRRRRKDPGLRCRTRSPRGQLAQMRPVLMMIVVALLGHGSGGAGRPGSVPTSSARSPPSWWAACFRRCS